ncbi:MAG TPA: YDG domain-containing protein, partial [Vicinamibacterales bacterium]|nr:YDG domain-containing protein [Vicinamibacterales bacterium]
TCSGTGSFDSSAVGAGKTVTSNNLALGGVQASNYALASTTATTTANIAAATVTPAITAASKPYDGTATATLTACTVSGTINGDVVTCSGTATFDSAATGAGKTVTATGLTLGGAASNYALGTTTATTTAAITALGVTPAVTVSNKTYDGTMTAALSSCTVSGVLAGETVGCTGTALFESASAGAGKTVQISSLALTGAPAANYVLTSTTATAAATISPLPVTASATIADKTYDATTVAQLSQCAVQGAVEGDVVTCTGTATFNTAAAGVGKTVTISNVTLTGAGSTNYALSSTSAVATAAINRRTVTPSVTVANKRFDGTTTAAITSCTLSGVVGGDVVTCTGTAAFASATAGTNKPVTATLALAGAAAANYVLSAATASTTASITANSAPALTNPGAQLGYTGVAAALTVASSDADGDSLTWSAQALPPGITLNTSTGALSGTPTTLGTFTTTVSASDGFDTTQVSFAWSIGSPVPIMVTPLSPLASITTTTPTLSWQAVPLVEYYLLRVADSGSDSPFDIWYTPAQAGCATGGTCVGIAPRSLKAGLVTWQVLAWNHFGYGPWSPTISVVIDLADALVPTPAATAPSGAIATRTPTYAFGLVSGASWYQLSVTDALGNTKDFWYTPTQACNASSCAATPSWAVATGLAKWRVRAWRVSGAGAWSAYVSFDAADALPGKVTLSAPSGSITTTTPTFTWAAMPNASYYLLNVTDRDNITYERWYRPGDAGCPLGTGTCTAAPGIVLKAGFASWKVLAWNGSGYGPWSDARDLLIEIADALAPVPVTVSPTGTVASTAASYRWTSVAGAINYRLSIRNNGGAPTYLWFTPAAAGCAAGGECVVTPVITLANGNAEWQVQAWTNNGYGAWSAIVAVTVNITAPTVPVLISPVGTLSTATPQLRWTASDNATLYYTRVFDSTGQRVDRWLSPAQVGCAAGGVCTFSPGVALASGAGSWQVIAYNPTGYSPWSTTMTFLVP